MRSGATNCLAALLLAAALLGCGGRTGLLLSTLSPDAGSGVPVDGAPPVEAGAACDAGAPPAQSYLLDDVGTLYRFDPATLQYTAMGVPSCNDGNVQWTMTASRENAYIVYTSDWTIFAVDLGTLACTPTAFQAGSLDLAGDFGVAVADIGGVETLYVYATDMEGNGPFLASADLESFTLTRIGDIVPAPPPSSFPVNLTADNAGHLYAYSPDGFVQEIDATTGVVLRSAQTTAATEGTWASLADAPQLLLFAGSVIDGYSFATGSVTTSVDGGVQPVGGNSVWSCPGE